ncbi:hypothetical protein H0H92_000282 [Tricholoma furcatifolium]|nr:hypothetical protein H0H92_000282 [Tricholoma furcatifolium]
MSHFIIKSIPFETRLAHDAKQILARDQARAKKLIAGLKPHGPSAFHSKPENKRNNAIDSGAQDSLDVTEAGVAYTVSVSVGHPPTEFSLLLDTSSSNTWIGADKDYTPSSTSLNKEQTFDISYESGEVTGAECMRMRINSLKASPHLAYTDLDQITLGGNLVAKKQTIGVASSARGFSGVDGILGIGPVNLASEGSNDIPPVTKNLFEAGVIPTVSIAMSYTFNRNKIANGEITVGATDTAKY